MSALAYVAALAMAAAPAPTAPAVPTARCMEDSPSGCWTWSTMGNHKRGVATVDGARRVVVGPCGFSRLVHRGLIDFIHTSHLRGDWTALRIGCKVRRPLNPADYYSA